jgi:hypothetical protein
VIAHEFSERGHRDERLAGKIRLVELDPVERDDRQLADRIDDLGALRRQVVDRNLAAAVEVRPHRPYGDLGR